MNRIYAGVMLNQDEVLRSLKERGFYSSGVPRSGRSGPMTGRSKEGKPRFHRMTRAELRTIDPQEFRRYVSQFIDHENVD